MVYLEGVILGFIIAAPVGPIGVLCIRRTLVNGYLTGFLSGLGAATADAFYGLVAALSLTVITDFLIGQQLWLRVAGGMFLCYLGFKSIRTRPEFVETSLVTRRLLPAYLSTFLLTLSNPVTIISFTAVFAGVGVGTAERSTLSGAVQLVSGVFTGSALWWLFLSSAVNVLRSRVGQRTVQAVNFLSGAAILTFGFVLLLQALG
jgi:threonine/homoserine/homoserine lactone efflux protein